MGDVERDTPISLGGESSPAAVAKYLRLVRLLTDDSTGCSLAGADRAPIGRLLERIAGAVEAVQS